jgi:hypothetical protein
MNDIDFLERFVDLIKNNIDLQGLNVYSVLMQDNDCIAVTLMPNGNKLRFYDGDYEQGHSLQINGQSKDELKIIKILNDICVLLDKEDYNLLVSDNDSFRIIDQQAVQYPNFIAKKENNMLIYGASATFTLYFNKE